VRVPDVLWVRVRTKALREGVAVTDVIEQLLEGWESGRQPAGKSVASVTPVASTPRPRDPSPEPLSPLAAHIRAVKGETATPAQQMPYVPPADPTQAVLAKLRQVIAEKEATGTALPDDADDDPDEPTECARCTDPLDGCHWPEPCACACHPQPKARR